MADHAPALAVDGCWNFRDALATAAAAGAPVRVGRLFRSDDATRLTSGGRAVVDSLALSAVIDLRQDVQHQRPQRFVSDERLLHRPLVDYVLHPESPQPIRDAGELADLYDGMLDRSLDRLGEILDTIAVRLDVGPVLFHCAFGKDRAGLVSAIVQAAIGVPIDAIAVDYARSDEPSRARRASLVDDPLPTDPPAPLNAPPFLFTAPESAMRELLERQIQRYGSLDDWIATVPVAPDTHGRLRHALLAH